MAVIASAARQSSVLIKQAFPDRHVASLLAMTNESVLPKGCRVFPSRIFASFADEKTYLFRIYRASSKVSSQAGRYTAIMVIAMPVVNASAQPISKVA